MGNVINKSIDLIDLAPNQIANFCGALNQNLKAIESHFGVNLSIKDNQLSLVSSEKIPRQTVGTIERILNESRDSALSADEVKDILNVADRYDIDELDRFTRT